MAVAFEFFTALIALTFVDANCAAVRFSVWDMHALYARQLCRAMRSVTPIMRRGAAVRNLKEVVDGLERQGIGLKALSQGIDTTTPGGRLFFHMLAAIAEFEHDLIVERTKDGLAAARARGRKGGGRFKMMPTKARQARAMYDEKTYTVQQIAETFGVSRGTIYRHLGEDIRA